VGGVGIVSLGVSVGFLVDWVSVQDTIGKQCPGNVCGPGVSQAQADSLRGQWDRDVAIFATLGAIGLVGIGVGIAGIAVGSKSSPKPSALPIRPRGLGFEF
jgi:hypothetical protein